VGWVIALVVLVLVAYGVWEFRWYLATLKRSLTSAAQHDEEHAYREAEPAGRPRSG
jgi:hypothetical protein